MSGQTWTPAPKKGAIPLHPMTFGMLLGRAFSALRHNPKVLFGFAVTVQFLVVLITVSVMLLVAIFIATRIATVPPSSPDFGPIVAGSVALGILAGVVLALASVAFTAVVQGLVAADVSFAAVSRRATLRMLWGRVRPAFWRLFAFSLLQSVAVLLWIALLFGIVYGLVAALGFDTGAAIAVGVSTGLLLVLGSIPLFIWLFTKMLVVPSVLVIEHATLRTAVVRSWRLIRGRFWPAFGVMFLIGAIMGIAIQVVSIPGSIIGGVIGGILAPTGGEDAAGTIVVIAISVLSQALVIAVGAIQLVVQGTGATLIYLDSRMRYEGLDQALIRHVERTALGTPDSELEDPYAVDPLRAVSSTPPPRPQTPPPPGYVPQQQYPAQAPYPYPGQAPRPGYAPTPGYAPQPGHAPTPGYPPQPGYPPTPGYAAQPGYPPAPAPREHGTPPYAPPTPPQPAPPAGPPSPEQTQAGPPSAEQTQAPGDDAGPPPWAPPGADR
ncbi:hypothetical protein [Microbacterium sp. NPDC058345]|uniref:hypothetical protein n=1 Tax=Microbacterium sp. NPDC058345 TaxID=3346455 RepID=UPI0036494D8C